MAPLPVDNGGDFIALEHEIHRTGIALYQRDAGHGLWYKAAQPVYAVAYEWICVTSEEVLKLRQLEVQVAQCTFIC